WDSSVASLIDAQPTTEFLSSSGRKPYCSDPTTDPAAFRVACVTLNTPLTPGRDATNAQASGVDGAGAIAEAHLKVGKSGEAGLQLSRVLLVDPVGTPLQSHTSDVNITLHVSHRSSDLRPLLEAGFGGLGVIG